MSLLWFIIIGIIAGWIAGLIMKGHGFGVVGDLAIGVVGAIIGGFLLQLVGIQAYGLSGSLAMSVLGAVVLLAIVGMLRRTAS